MREALLKEISKHTPYKLDDVTYIYDNVNSFDKTIVIINMASAYNTSLQKMLEIYREEVISARKKTKK